MFDRNQDEKLQRNQRSEPAAPDSMIASDPRLNATARGELSARAILKMQQTQGNSAVRRMLSKRRNALQRDDDSEAQNADSASSDASAPAAADSATPLSSLDQETKIMMLGEGGALDEATSETVQRDPTPARPTVSANVASGPTYRPDGEFLLTATWQTSARSGFIVQEVSNSHTVTSCSNAADTASASQTYWEAWNVGSTGAVTPVDNGVNDVFTHPAMTPIVHRATEGGWSKIGRTYWVSSLDPAAGFAVGNVRSAGTLLLSTSTRPGNLGSSLGSRSYGGAWNSCDPAHMTHTST